MNPGCFGYPADSANSDLTSSQHITTTAISISGSASTQRYESHDDEDDDEDEEEGHEDENDEDEEDNELIKNIVMRMPIRTIGRICKIDPK